MKAPAAIFAACVLAGCASDRPPRSPYAVEPQPARLAREQRDKVLFRDHWSHNPDAVRDHFRIRGREPFAMFEQVPDAADAWRRGVRAMHPDAP